MPRQTREERRAALAETAGRFKQWLAPLMTERRLGPTEIAKRASRIGGTFEKGAVSHWAAGDNVPDPTNAVLIARVLDEPPVAALRAAGYDDLADAYEHDPVIELLDSMGMPGLTDPIAKQYLADLETARTRAREQADRLKREREAANG
jgi:hypothetical protein